MSGFLWLSSKWAYWFGCSLQYTPGLEVLACSIDTDINYVTTVLQLRSSMKHSVKLQHYGEDVITFWVYHHRYITPAALSWTRGPLLNFPAKCINVYSLQFSIHEKSREIQQPFLKILFLYHLIRRDTGQIANKAFLSNPIIVSLKQ